MNNNTHPKHPILNDMAKLAGGATGLAMGIKDDITNTIQTQINHHLAKANLVTREEFEVVKTMAQTARAENEKLQTEIAELKQAQESAKK